MPPRHGLYQNRTPRSYHPRQRGQTLLIERSSRQQRVATRGWAASDDARRSRPSLAPMGQPEWASQSRAHLLIDRGCRPNMTRDRPRLGKNCLESAPKRSEPMRLGRFQRQHGVVVDARFLDMGQLRHEQTEVHDVLQAFGLTRLRKASRHGVRAHHRRRIGGLLAFLRQNRK
jgi:hypothetical protein